MIKKLNMEFLMKKSNSEILNRVKNIVSEKNENISKVKKFKTESLENVIDLELKSWIENNAERIAREIILHEVKKLFK